jgi:integrase
MGDLPLAEISREEARAYFKWWNDLVAPSDPEEKPKSPKTANKHFGDMRDLYQKYYTFMGEEERQNPFRNLTFRTKKSQQKKRLPFSNTWVRDKFLRTGAMDGLTPELFLTTCMAIETGCRPGELINLRPEDIRLDAKVPHLKIAEREDRQQKTEIGSIREVPLIGVALEAARRAPLGFPKYHDKINSFSAAVSAAFTRRKLFETPDHVYYSFRHSFEDRMKEAELDYELRMLILGHDNKRPEYGIGGSMDYRLKELQKISHPYPTDFFDAFDASPAG